MRTTIEYMENNSYLSFEVEIVDYFIDKGKVYFYTKDPLFDNIINENIITVNQLICIAEH